MEGKNNIEKSGLKRRIKNIELLCFMMIIGVALVMFKMLNDFNKEFYNFRVRVNSERDKDIEDIIEKVVDSIAENTLHQNLIEKKFNYHLYRFHRHD